MESSQPVPIPLDDIRLATNDFSYKNLIGKGAFGKVYTGKLPKKDNTVAVKRLDRRYGHGEHEFQNEIKVLSCITHPNIINLVGYCKEIEECILVYEYAENGSLEKNLIENNLSWTQRLQISIAAARCFSHLHNDQGPQRYVLHRDIKSSNILLSENMEVKVSDFGLAKTITSNDRTNPSGTKGYVDPEYVNTGIPKKECDVYSFGVVLFEILSGKLAYNEYQDENKGMLLSSLAQKYYKRKKLVEIIDPNLQIDKIDAESFKIFSMVAYNCLNEDSSKRPDMASIVDELEKALRLQENKEDRSILVGTCGTENRGQENFWSFKLEENHHLSNITINYDDDAIYSLILTSESNGVPYNSKKFGSWKKNKKVSEVSFKSGETIICIKVTVGTIYDDGGISSLSFVTSSKNTYGPYGVSSRRSELCIPWENGCFNGFYGLASFYIYGIGVYVKPDKEIVSIGPLGGTGLKGFPPRPFELNGYDYITIQHDVQIHAIWFTTEHEDSLLDSESIAGKKGEYVEDKVSFDLDEEIHAIKGTLCLSVVEDVHITVLTSISFLTNKKLYGPYGKKRGTPFTVECSYGQFLGFYGMCGYYIDSIGIHWKASTQTSRFLTKLTLVN